MTREAEIAVVGLACHYPDARSPRELWENVLARRQAFRRFRPERMPAAYHSDDPSAEDRTYGRLGAFLDGFVFDCAARRIPRSTYAATDLSHWLALEVATRALEDAGVPQGRGLAGDRTAVIVGNSLTGEFSRANSMRLRWPFVERVLHEAARERGIPLDDIAPLIAATGERFRSYFPATSEDTLAGALSNTIAGRICGVFDFGGGGYVVDGACASSLLAVCTAASALEEGRVDAVVAGGVDISMDPFELVGFAKAKALSPTRMRVYDRRGNGFVPGEGCAFVVLQRLEDARAAGRPVYAILRGWGVSSDGRNAITAPKVEGQARAIRQAWARAGVPAFVEGHGTGTALGDRVELEAIASVAAEHAGEGAGQIGVTSLKSILGHTKAAAGIGAFLKAVMAVNRRVLPPTCDCSEPNPVFEGPARSLYPILRGELRDAHVPLRAGASAMGFGGINAHVVVESGDAPDARLAPTRPEAELLASGQDTELFVLAADSRDELDRRLESLRRDAIDLARGELPDLSAALIERLPAHARVRAAIVAETPAQLVERIDRLRAAGPAELRGPELWLGEAKRTPKLAFVCPGQGSQDLDMARWILERDPALREAMHALAGPELIAALHPELAPTDVEARRAARERLSATEVAQPALCLVTLAWARKLAAFGLRPDLVAGHSLGELSALALAGAYDEPTLMRLATRRGRLMAVPAERPAGMTSLACDRARAASLLAGLPGHASIANVNGPRQIVVAGECAALDELEARAARVQVTARRLPVSNAFHSALVGRAAAALADAAWIPAHPVDLNIPVVSTLAPIDARTDLRRYVGEHARAEVDWMRSVEQLSGAADLIIEVGAGRVLSGLIEAIVGPQGVRCLPVEGSAGRVADLHAVLASAWVFGADLRWTALHEHRFVRPLVLASQRSFIVNPCEAGVESREVVQPIERTSSPRPREHEADVMVEPATAARPTRSPLEQLIAAVAARTGFEPASIEPSARLREDLNLDSIKAGEIIASVAVAFGVADRIDPAQLSNHPLAQIAAALLEAGAAELIVPSVDASPALANNLVQPNTQRDPAHRWVRSFALQLSPAAPPQPPRSDARVRVIAHDPRLAAALRRTGITFDDAQPDTLIVAPEGEIAEQVELLAGAIAAIGPSVRALVFVQRTGGRFGVEALASDSALERPLVGVDAFARSLSLERPQLAVTVVDLARELSPTLLLAELPTRPGFVACGLDGRARWTLVADPLALPSEPAAIDLHPGELVLVTGGARGITAACALALARATKVRLALVGSTPRDEVDDEVLHTLGRLALEGIEARYWSCDLADPTAVAQLVERVRAEQGPIAALVHGAGRNQPRRVEQVDAAAALHELAPKLLGMQALLHALESTPPRHVVALTSIIGVSGMQGNAWYAYANAMLDLELARFLARHPGTRGRSLAYGVWDEIGMGAKLGSVGALAKRGIGALAPSEGTQRFLALLAARAAPRQIVVTAHVDDLPTWPALPCDDAKLRFLDGERRGVPGVDARLLIGLHPERDTYLRDHCFGGSLLFPTVYGLEAMAQAAWVALGASAAAARVVEIREVQLPAPIVVAEQGSTIAIHAIVRERVGAGDPFVVDAEIRCESTGMARAHFRATFEFGDAPEPVAARFPSLPAPPRPLVPTRDLYGGLLFQGPVFQRMGTIEGAIDHAMIFSAELREPGAAHERWLLGDPHVRDVLLQSGQVLIPRDDALPVAIERITLAQGHAQPGGRRVWTTIDRSDARSHFATVRVIDARGRELERIDGYEVRVLAHHDDRPDFAAIVSGEGDEARVRELVEAACRSRGLAPPKLALAAMDLHALLPERRRALLRPLLHELEPQLEPRWDGEGRPSFEPDARGLSIAHDEHAALVVTSEHAIGCDLECVRPREATLLGPELRALLPALRAAGDDEASAITRAWAVGEALFKLRGRTELASLRVVTHASGVVELAHADATILAFALALARGPRRVLALALPRASERPSLPEPESDTLSVRMHRDAHADRMEARFVVAFDESGSLAGKLPAYVLATYMGRLRELALAQLAAPLRACLASGVHGMVTEAAGVELEGELEALDRVEAHTWVEDLQSGSCTLRFAFHRIDAQGRLARVGEAYQRFGWVEVLGHGLIRAAAFPPFMREFLTSLRHAGSRSRPPALLVPRTPPLREAAFSTGLLDGNVVGNLYFAHTFKWPWRVLERVLHDARPELFHARGHRGELLVTSQRVEYLREAMPFDTIEVALHVERLAGSELEIAVESRRREASGDATRLALGRIHARWVVRDERGRAQPAAIPSDLLHLLTPTSTP